MQKSNQTYTPATLRGRFCVYIARRKSLFHQKLEDIMRDEEVRVDEIKDEVATKKKKLHHKHLIEEKLREIKELRAAFAKW